MDFFLYKISIHDVLFGFYEKNSYIYRNFNIKNRGM